MQRKMEQQATALFSQSKSLRAFFEYVFLKSKGPETGLKTIPHDTAAPLLRSSSYIVLFLSNRFYRKGPVIEAMCEYVETVSTRALTKDDWNSIVTAI